jgi:hypothetical protein
MPGMLRGSGIFGFRSDTDPCLCSSDLGPPASRLVGENHDSLLYPSLRGSALAPNGSLATSSPRSATHLLVNRVRQVFGSRMLAKPPPIDPTIRRELLEVYKKDIPKLEELVGRDLSLWLEDEDRKNASAGVRKARFPVRELCSARPWSG